MEFLIQASCPKYTGEFDENDYNLATAIETIFPMETEKAIMVWKTIYIPLCYKYDVSCMIDDVLNLLERLRKNLTGQIKIHWSSNTFANIWDIRWDGEYMEIEPKWNSVLGHTEQLLNLKGTIKISKESFANEWKRVLHKVIEGLKLSKYCEDKILGMNRLICEYNAIAHDGILYVSK